MVFRWTLIYNFDLQTLLIDLKIAVFYFVDICLLITIVSHITMKFSYQSYLILESLL